MMLKLAEQLVKGRRETFICEETLDEETHHRHGNIQVLRSALPLKAKPIENRESHFEKLLKALPSDPRDRISKELEIRKMELRKEVIGGDFMNSQIDCYGKRITTLNTWQVREWQLLVFISSTFTDTKAERNILLEKILPYLRNKAYPHDIEVTFVDMRSEAIPHLHSPDFPSSLFLSSLSLLSLSLPLSLSRFADGASAMNTRLIIRHGVNVDEKSNVVVTNRVASSSCLYNPTNMDTVLCQGRSIKELSTHESIIVQIMN
jgi:hypothetical protein